MSEIKYVQLPYLKRELKKLIKDDGCQIVYIEISKEILVKLLSQAMGIKCPK